MKKLGWLILSLAAIAPASADPREDAMSAMIRCTGVAEAPSRLACYDSAVGRVRGVMVAPAPQVPPAQPGYPPPPPQHSFSPAPPQAAIPPPAPPPRRTKKDTGFLSKIFGDGGPARPPQTTIQQFGSESIAYHGDRAYPSHREGDTIDAISARLVAYRFAADRRLSVSLDNGQDWLETSGEDMVGYLAKPALSYSAQIERDSGGSYAMTLTGVFRSIPVRRIR